MNLLDGMKINSTITNTKGSNYYKSTYNSNLDLFTMVSRYNSNDEIIRLFRIFKRKDNQGIKEILRRTKKDKETFKNYKSNYQVRNKNINTTINEILHIININI